MITPLLCKCGAVKYVATDWFTPSVKHAQTLKQAVKGHVSNMKVIHGMCPSCKDKNFLRGG